MKIKKPISIPEGTNALSAIIILLQFVALAFIGGFARTTTVQSSFSYLAPNILFYLTWILMFCPYKKLTLHALGLMLMSSALAFQCNLLFGRFWYNVFTQFGTSYQLTAQIVIESTAAIFPVLLVFIDCIGILRNWQVYVLLVPIINFGWSLNYCILRYGLKIFDGGQGLTSFLFSGVCTLTIWIFSIRNNAYLATESTNYQDIYEPQTQIYKNQQHYDGYTLSLYGGMIGSFFIWPYFNASCSLLSSSISSVNSSISDGFIFQNTAYTNTILALSMGFLLSFVLANRDGSGQNKSKISSCVDCFTNSGIVCACFVDISLNPAAAMAMAFLASFLTIFLYIYYDSIDQKTSKIQTKSLLMVILLHYSRAFLRIILSLFGIIVTCIVVANRQYSSIQLLNTDNDSTVYARTAGLQFAAFFISFAVAALTGVVSGLVINAFANLQKRWEKNDRPKLYGKISDRNLFTDVHVESFCLFLEPQDKLIDQQQKARRMLKQAILSHVKNTNQSFTYASVTKPSSRTAKDVQKQKIINTINTELKRGNEQVQNQKRELQKKKKLEDQYTKMLRHHKIKEEKNSQLAQKRQQQLREKQEKQYKQRKELQQKKQKQEKERIEKQKQQLERKKRALMPKFYVDHLQKSPIHQIQEPSEDPPQQIPEVQPTLNRVSSSDSKFSEPKSSIVKSRIQYENVNVRERRGVSVVSKTQKNIHQEEQIQKIKSEHDKQKQINRKLQYSDIADNSASQIMSQNQHQQMTTL